jgi:hypothetical protein
MVDQQGTPNGKFVRIIILDGFIEASLLYGVLTVGNNDSDVVSIVVNPFTSDTWLNKIQLMISAGHNNQVVISEFKEQNTSSNPYYRFGISLNLKNILKERRIRRSVLIETRRLLRKAEHYGEVREVWAGPAYLTSALKRLRPDLKYIKIDHGLSDFLDTHSVSTKKSLRQSLRILAESVIFGYAQVLPRWHRRIRLFDVIDPRNIEQIRMLWEFLGEGIFETYLNRSRVLVLTPSLYELPEMNHVEEFGLWLIETIGPSDQEVEILLKSHPTSAKYGASDYLPALRKFLLQNRSLKVTTVRILPNDLPAELVLVGHVSLLVGVMSSVFLMSQFFAVEVPVRRQILWGPMLIEMLSAAERFPLPNVSNSRYPLDIHPSEMRKFWLEREYAEESYWNSHLENFFLEYPRHSWRIVFPLRRDGLTN